MATVTSIQTPTTQQTRFEQDLKTYFPDLYQFWSLSKFDRNYDRLMDAILDMVNKNKYGTIEVFYQSGKINHVFKKENMTVNDIDKSP